jgi:hypothetical protein
MIRPLSASILAMMVAWSQAALAEATAIGQIKTLSGDVAIARGGAKVPARVGDAVYEADTVETGAGASIGITFTDNTVMAAGPDSEVALAQYKFDSGNFTGSMLTDMRKGTLTMVSGDIARSSPGAMQVKTPTAMLGVRGTRFAIAVPGNAR